MKIILFLFSLLMISCSADKSPSDKQQTATTKQRTQQATSNDSMQVDISADFVTGQFDFEDRDDFVKVDQKYAHKEMYLHQMTYDAFKAMADSAQKEDITFTIVSGARNYADQKSIWERKWLNSDAPSGLDKAMEILEYSSMPMTSRHHWGTEVDLNNLNNSYFEEGRGKKEYEWLQAHANQFGFYLPYTNKSVNNRTGYNEEKWHWSYLPLAEKYLEYYNQHLTNADIQGFKGSELASEIDMVQNYVNGISAKIKEESR